MHVFFDEQIFVAQEQGGISRYYSELAIELGAQDVSADICAGISRNLYLPGLVGRKGIIVRSLRRRDRLRINTALSRFSRLWARWEFARTRRQHESLVYHATNYAVDRWMADRADAVCVTVFDMIGELFGDAPSRGRSLETKRRAVSIADVGLCISEQTRRDLVAVLPDCESRLAVTLLASSLSQPSTEDRAAAARRGPYFLMVGKRHGYKNGAVALQAFAKVAETDPQVRLVCFGGEPLTPEETALLPRDLMDARVTLAHGGDERLAAFYTEATGLLYPSRYEGFGLPVLEAMQLGCPVLTTRCASLPEVAGDAAVYLDPDDVPSWSREAGRLRLDANWRRQLTAKGRDQAARFSWKATAQQTIRAYEEALARKTRAGRRLPLRALSEANKR